MKNKELYDRTVSILVQAYFNNTLKHGDCAACAVGNICAANGADKIMRNYRYAISWAGTTEGWASVFFTSNNGTIISPENYIGLAKEVIDCTGYTWQELSEIENAFETASRGISEDEWMFNGLMAVIEVLDQIHQNTDASITSTSKARFDKSLC